MLLNSFSSIQATFEIIFSATEYVPSVSYYSCPPGGIQIQTGQPLEQGILDVVHGWMRDSKVFQITQRERERERERSLGKSLRINFQTPGWMGALSFLAYPTSHWCSDYLIGPQASQVAASGKELACQSKRLRRCGFDSWVGKIPWRRICQSTPVSCLGNPMDRGVWWATVHGVTKSQTWVKQLSSTHTHKILTTPL